jgi:HTH-type transcriptional regulator, transcriptional repressor of NAD biosynthesis genes
MEKELKQENHSGLIKVVLIGPESSGKRPYLQKKWDEKNEICTYEDLLFIAKGQIKLENKLGKVANRLLVCDTDLLTTLVYSHAYFGRCDRQLEIAAHKSTYSHYFLTDIDVPWVKDDLRDRPPQREHMFGYFKKALDAHKLSYTLLKGRQKTRMKAAIKVIDSIFTSKNTE